MCISSKVSKIIICCLILVKFSKSDSNILFFSISRLNILYLECKNFIMTLHSLNVMGIKVADRRRWQSAITSPISDVGSESVIIEQIHNERLDPVFFFRCCSKFNSPESDSDKLRSDNCIRKG